MQNIHLLYFFATPLILANIFSFFLKSPSSINEFTSHSSLNNNDCSILQTGASHDIVVDDLNGIAYLASAPEVNRFNWFPGIGKFGRVNMNADNQQNTNQQIINDDTITNKHHDAFYLFNISSKAFQKASFLNYDPSNDFVVHGIALRSWSPGINTLYIVNHQRNHSIISIFNHTVADGPFLVHLRDVYHSKVYTPNSIAPVSPTRYFVSNDHFSSSKGYLRLLETFLQPCKTTNVVMCDIELDSDAPDHNVHCDYAIDWINAANGLEYVPDKYTPYSTDSPSESGKLFVAEATAGQVSVYNYNQNGSPLNDSLLQWNASTVCGSSLRHIHRISGTPDILVTGIADSYQAAMYLHHGPSYLDKNISLPVMAAVLKASENYESSHLAFYDQGHPDKLAYVTSMSQWKTKLLGVSCTRPGLLVCNVEIV